MMMGSRDNRGLAAPPPQMKIEKRFDTSADLSLLEDAFDNSRGEDSMIEEELPNRIAAIELNNMKVEPKVEIKKEEVPWFEELIGTGFTFPSFLLFLQNENIFRLETHFKWMLEIDGEKLTLERIRSLQEKMACWVAEDDAHLSFFQKVNQHLLLGVYETCLNGYTEAVAKHFDTAKKIVEEAETNPDEGEQEVPVQHWHIYKMIYMYDDYLACIGTKLLKKTNEDFDQVKDDINLFHEQQLIATNDNKANACLRAIQADIAKQLGNTQLSLELFKEASELNPECFDWTHFYYTSMRRLRRETDFLSPPYPLEKELCFRAHKLCPDSWRGLLSVSNFYEDWNRSRISSREKEENIQKMVEALLRAREKAPNNITVNVKLAEAYSCKYNLSKEERLKALEIFGYCKEQWPNNSQVFHKIGKYFNNKENDPVQGRWHFLEGLKIDSTNFPCLMDYLRLELPNLTIEKMIEEVDKFIPSFQYKKVYFGKLSIIKGFLCWRANDTLKAIESWLQLFDEIFQENDAEAQSLRVDLMKTLNGGNPMLPFTLKQAIGADQILKQVTLFHPGLKKRDPKNEERLKRFKAFLNNELAFSFNGMNGGGGRSRTNSSAGSIASNGDRNYHHNNNTGNSNWRRNNGQEDGRSVNLNTNQRGGANLNNYRNCEADSDSNWRRGGNDEKREIRKDFGMNNNQQQQPPRNGFKREYEGKSSRIQLDSEGR